MKKLLIIMAVIMFLYGCATTGVQIPLEGAYNVRDMGGYRTEMNRKVKYGRVYRAGELNKLTVNDLDVLAKLDIRTVIDFRSDYEAENAPGMLPETVTVVVPLRIVPGNVYNIEEVMNMNAEEMEGFMEAVYVDLITGAEAQEKYTEFFRLITGVDAEEPFLFHCTAGKDRTGIAAALFLSALGVDRETVYKDYMLSAEYVKPKYAYILEHKPAMAPLLTVKMDYIKTAFNIIDSKYGDVYGYMQNFLGVDLERMRQLYTE